jgi:DHA2 family methylenomycin A resistance protein-like MFS transporter
VVAVALLLLSRTERSPRRAVPFDWAGQAAAVLAMGALTYGAIEAGAAGFAAPRVLGALAVAVVALAVFLAAEARGTHPMLPLDLFRSRTVVISVAVGFAFMVGFYGLIFLFSLYFQELRGLSALDTGLAFLPMTALVAFLNPVAARVAEKVGPRVTIVAGQFLMVVGLLTLCLVPAGTPTWLLAVLMFPVGLGGPLAIPPVTALLLDSVPPERAGTASAVLNTFRQVGGALAVALFGALVAHHATFLHGLRVSLLIAALLLLATAASSLLLRPTSAAPAAADQRRPRPLDRPAIDGARPAAC